MFKIPLNLPLNVGKTCTLYFIECGEFVKVGLADDPEKRVRQLQLGNPHPLRLVARRTIPKALHWQVEKLAHDALAEWSIGREWFRMSGRDALAIVEPIIRKAHKTVAKWVRDDTWTGTRREDMYGEAAYPIES